MERGEERVSHRVLFLSAQREKRSKGTGPSFVISGRHYYGERAGSLHRISLFLRPPVPLFPRGLFGGYPTESKVLKRLLEIGKT